MLQLILAGLSLGLLSGFHCIGMCGPLALALPVNHLQPLQKKIALILYNIGRISTYIFFGLIFGLLGRKIYLAGYQQVFSIIIGSLLLLSIFYFILKKNKSPLFIQKIYAPVQQFLFKLWQPKKKYNYYLLGLANGLLPCGMVYIALAGALTQTSVQNSMAFMAFFGLGTIPFMFAFSYFGSFVKLSFRNKIKQAMPFVFGVMGLLLILRGMNLGIPFVSPAMQEASKPAAVCH